MFKVFKRLSFTAVLISFALSSVAIPRNANAIVGYEIGNNDLYYAGKVTAIVGGTITGAELLALSCACCGGLCAIGGAMSGRSDLELGLGSSAALCGGMGIFALIPLALLGSLPGSALLVGIVLLDSPQGQGVTFKELDINTATQLGITEAQRISFNAELPALNSLNEDFFAQTTQTPAESEKDNQFLKDGFSKLKPATFEAVQRIATFVQFASQHPATP